MVLWGHLFDKNKNMSTQDDAAIQNAKALVTDKQVQAVALSESERIEVERTFEEAKSFREVGEKITAPLDSIITETAVVIQNDPIMKVSDELAQMNKDVQSVYSDIIDNDGIIMKTLKSIPVIGNLAAVIDRRKDEALFNIKSIEGKIATIFDGFDTSYNSINTSIEVQEKFLAGIDENIGKVVAYKEFLEEKIGQFSDRLEDAENEHEEQKLTLFINNVEYFQGNLIVLIGNLDMARKRLLIRLDSANKLSLAMNSSRPIFKTLLSTAVIETSSQKAIEASIKTMKTMGETIDKMSSDLTDKAIESNKATEELTNKPVLSATVFIENVSKLKNHFDEIETYRKQVKEEAKAEKKLFAEAKDKLKKVKTLSVADHKELEKELGEAFEEEKIRDNV